MTTVIRRYPFAVTGSNAALLPVLQTGPSFPLKALFLPSSWDAASLTWRDLTKQGNDLVATSAPTAPTLATASGVSYLDFPVAGNLHTPGAFTLAQPFTVMGIMKLAGYPSTARFNMVYMSNGTDAYWSGSVFSSGAVSTRVGAVDITTQYTGVAPLDTTGWHTHGSVFNGASSAAIVDGNSTTGAPTVTSAAGTFGVACGNSTASANTILAAKIACIAIAPAALTTAQRTELRSYLMAQVGL